MTDLGKTKTLLDTATEAVVRVHDEEMRAALKGEYPSDQWRPERYAQAVLDAVVKALEYESAHIGREDPVPGSRATVKGADFLHAADFVGGH